MKVLLLSTELLIGNQECVAEFGGPPTQHARSGAISIWLMLFRS